jgi:ribonuclease HII
MLELHKQYPQYNFAVHKGYGVPEHMRLIHKYGPSLVHRKTFAPVKYMLAANH